MSLDTQWIFLMLFLASPVVGIPEPLWASLPIFTFSNIMLVARNGPPRGIYTMETGRHHGAGTAILFRKPVVKHLSR